MGWTDEQVEELKRLWNEGLTTGEISPTLSAVAGVIVATRRALIILSAVKAQLFSVKPCLATILENFSASGKRLILSAKVCMGLRNSSIRLLSVSDKSRIAVWNASKRFEPKTWLISANDASDASTSPKSTANICRNTCIFT